MMNGDKHDNGKPRWSLLPCGTIAQILAVLEHGAQKYAVDNWMHVPDAERRYYDAAMRHIDAWLHGEKNDPDSGLPHIAHAVCCLLYILWFDNRKEKPSDPETDKIKRQLDETKRKNDGITRRMSGNSWMDR